MAGKLGYDVIFQGTDELVRAFNAVGFLGESDEAYEVAASSARVIWKEIRDRAPVGPTGNLRNSVTTFKLPKRRGESPAAVVRIRLKRGRGAIGPHAHLVEYGTPMMRYVRRRGAMFFVVNGEKVFAEHVAKMPAKPFFRPGLDAAKDRAIRIMEREALDMIERHYEKGR